MSELIGFIEAQQAQGEPVAAQHRFRHPQKTMPNWSPWQPAEINTKRPSWGIDSVGYEVEYRLLYSAPPAPAAVPEENGFAVIEKALKQVSAGDLSEAPFGLTGNDAAIWLEGAKSAYLHALEMIAAPAPAEPECEKIIEDSLSHGVGFYKTSPEGISHAPYNDAVQVCPRKDHECGIYPGNWCQDCPKHHKSGRAE